MFAIAFDLNVADTLQNHPRGLPQAYSEIRDILDVYGFRRVQGSLYVTNDENMAQLFAAIQDLRSQAWFPHSVKDIRAFRVEQWSDFTPIIKAIPPPV